MSLWLGLAVAAVTLSAATICLALVRPYLAHRRLIDVPNHRSSHTEPTVRGGGLGIVAGLLVGLGLSALLLSGSAGQLSRLAAVGLTVTGLAAVGFIEDVRGLRVGIRLTSQALTFGIASVVFVLVGGLPGVAGLVAWFAGVFYVNATNFMDGVNGMSSMHGSVVGAYFAVIGYVSAEPGLMLTGVTVGVAFLAFLPWNAPRARMFMGDAGSYALGASAWALSVWAVILGIPPLVIVAPLLVYAADVVFTLLRRAMRAAPLTQAHHDHAYQQMQRITNSHGWAAGLVTMGTVACAGFGLWNLFVSGVTPWALACNMTVVALILATPILLVRRRESTSRARGTLQ